MRGLGRLLRAAIPRQAGIQRTEYRPRRGSYLGPTRGMVVRVIPGDARDEQLTTPHQVLCDVLIARGGIVRCPVMQRGSSVTNTSRWVPQAARTNIVTGAAVKLVADGLSPPPSDLEDLDGDLVLIDWIEGDVHRPVIVGSLEHPRRARQQIASYTPPSVVEGEGYGVRRHSEVGERFLAHQGTTARLDRGGSVRIDLRRAGVANDGRTYDVPGLPAGNVDIAIRSGSEVVVRNEAGEPVFRVQVADDGTTTIRVGKATGERILLAGPTVDYLDQIAGRLNEIGARVGALWQIVAPAALTASASGSPAPVQVPPAAALAPDVAGLVNQSWGYTPAELASAIAGRLKAAAMRISPRSLG